MIKYFYCLLLIIFTACGRTSDYEEPTDTQPVVRIDPRAQAALSLYEKTTGVSTAPLQELYFVTQYSMLEVGRCDSYWEGNVYVMRIIISDEALVWSPARFNLLIAHELEHCLRGIAHEEDIETPHLMRPTMLTEDEVKEKSYEEWVLTDSVRRL